MKYKFRGLPNSVGVFDNKNEYQKKEGKYMKKLVKKMVEKYARSSTNSCIVFIVHQPRAPRCLIEK